MPFGKYKDLMANAFRKRLTKATPPQTKPGSTKISVSFVNYFIFATN